MTADKLIPHLDNVLQASKHHSEVYAASKRSGTDFGVRYAWEDYRKAVSKLFREVVGRFPEQWELELIDPDFKVKED